MAKLKRQTARNE